MKDKSQVAMYVILGLAVIFGITVFVVVNQQATPGQPSVREQIPEEFTAVRARIEQCLGDSLITNLQLLGAQGGYIQPAQAGISANDADATSGTGVRLFSSVVVPYWWYLSSSNACSGQCAFDTKRPELLGTAPTSIQSQLTRALENDVTYCDISMLSSMGFVTVAAARPAVTLTITDTDVRAFLKFPLNVSTADKKQVVSEFETRADVPLQRMYEYALATTALAAEYRFVEKQAIELVSLFSGVSSDKLPPMSGSSYEYVNTVFWIKDAVAQKVFGMLDTYVQAFQFMGSRNFEDRAQIVSGQSPAVIQVYRNMDVPLNETLSQPKRYAAFDVSVVKPSTTSYFAVNADGQLIKPQSFTVNFFPFFGLHQFSTLYDISYPVVFSIHDAAALKGEGYTFNFAYEANIRDNIPLTSTYASVSYRGEDAFAGQTYFCDELQRNSGAVDVTITDALTGSRISGVSLTHTCGSESCVVGATDAAGSFTQPLPLCVGGSLQIQKEGYGTHSIALSTLLDEPVNEQFSLSPLQDIEVVARKHLLVKNPAGGYMKSANSIDQEMEEDVMIVFTQVGPSGETLESGIIATAVLTGGKFVDTISLAPGTYEVSLTALSNAPINIPAKRQCTGGLFSKCFQLPPVDLAEWPSGSLTRDGSNGYVTITDEIYSKPVLEVPYVGAQASDFKVLEDLDLLGLYETYDDGLTVSYSDTPIQGVSTLRAILQSSAPIGEVASGSSIDLWVTGNVTSYSIDGTTSVTREGVSVKQLQLPVAFMGIKEVIATVTLTNGEMREFKRRFVVVPNASRVALESLFSDSVHVTQVDKPILPTITAKYTDMERNVPLNYPYLVLDVPKDLRIEDAGLVSSIAGTYAVNATLADKKISFSVVVE